MRLALGFVVAAVLAASLVGVIRLRADATAVEARVTFYLPTGNAMRSGIYPYAGAAACDWNVMPMGTRFILGGREYTCLDTGGAVRGWHVDLFVWTWNEGAWLRSVLGDWNVLEVIHWGQNPPWWRGR